MTIRRTGRALAASAALPLLAASLVVLSPSAPATAATCTHPAWQNKSAGAGKGTKTGGTPLRSGPYAACSGVTISNSKDLFYHCWVRNTEGNYWTHVRVANSETYGWVWNENLNDGGSTAASKRCDA
ncbi:hypothetical protein CCO04_24895 [Pimelobacter sp. 30-1]|nr:hypothetical protein [Pimelobacter sp. 30-1]